MDRLRNGKLLRRQPAFSIVANDRQPVTDGVWYLILISIQLDCDSRNQQPSFSLQSPIIRHEFCLKAFFPTRKVLSF